MPLKGVRYRYTKSGVRLAFKGGEVVEAKGPTGKTHTPAEFKADKRKHSLLRGGK